jgi:hypothetical protein
MLTVQTSTLCKHVWLLLSTRQQFIVVTPRAAAGEHHAALLLVPLSSCAVATGRGLGSVLEVQLC